MDDTKRKADLTPQEATYELMQTFRPIRESVDELRRLLEAKADPNADIPQGRISPLQHVMLFAPKARVAAMRTALLLHDIAHLCPRQQKAGKTPSGQPKG